MQIAPQQDQALKAVSRWFNSPSSPPWFYLGGFAGTGKTTLAKHFAESLNIPSVYCAYTGKAALVMRKKGCVGASTIHSLIYTRDPEAPPGVMRFVLNPISPFAHLDKGLIIVDECSMVSRQLGEDLLTFGKKVLVLGDPAQLPPIEGAGYFTQGEPDFLLTDIHRQAAGNPIVYLAKTVREGGRLKVGRFGDSSVIPQSRIDWDKLAQFEQTLVGTNKTRHLANDQLRSRRGHGRREVEPGDRVICLKNNRAHGLLNGGMWTVSQIARTWRGVRLTIESLDEPQTGAIDVNTHPLFFEGRENELGQAQRQGLDEFSFGDAITVHKSQGSQWSSVAVIDESKSFREDAQAHLYTAITRAADRVLIALPVAASSLGGV